MKQYWLEKTLSELTDTEWEQLCDRCGRCCLVKLEDDVDGTVFYTNVVCAQYNQQLNRCSCYSQRFERVPDCLSIRSFDEKEMGWLPVSCAYRRIAEGRALASWHPLISGGPDSVKDAGISLDGKVISEKLVEDHELEHHIVTWVE